MGGNPTGAWMSRLVRTVSAPGPWLVALVFAVYAGQWLAVIGFLPSVFVTDASAGVLAAAPLALVAAVNMVGNIAAGRLLQRGIAPHWLLMAGFSAMVVGAWLAFVALPGGDGAGLPMGWRYGGVLLFSLFGGMVPGTLFSLAGAVAPDASCVSTTVGWMQQWSSFGAVRAPARGGLGGRQRGPLALDLAGDGQLRADRHRAGAGLAHGVAPEVAPMSRPAAPDSGMGVLADMQRWLERAVIGLNLCPFAKSVVARGQVHWVVSTAAGTPALEEGTAARAGRPGRCAPRRARHHLAGGTALPGGLP